LVVLRRQIYAFTKEDTSFLLFDKTLKPFINRSIFVLKDKTLITKQKSNLFLRLSIALALIAVLFKMMHWPFAEIILIIAAVGISLFYSIWFYLKTNKTWLDYAKLFLLISFLLHYLFRVLHLNYGYIFSYIFRVALVLFIIAYIKDTFFSNEDSSQLTESQPNLKRKIFSIIINTIAVLCIIIGAQLKILHWEFGFINGNILLAVGFVAASLSIILGFKKS
tara:strand:- start:37913 stop:38578 length:666 start_codon:yes stop_codon:yes gene_type:complete